jgi:putative DNA base modification enzyme with NMAD domain
MAAFLANVGVNASHAATSPLYEDGSFHLTPIPEALPWRPPMLRFSDIAGSTIPLGWAARAAHLDPDLTSATPTYGDNCRTAGRAFSLRRAQHGDLIAFVARLNDPAGAATFQLVGCLDVEDVLPDVARDPGPGWWDGNAHVRRGRAHGEWNSFWVFLGGGATRVFPRAVPFARAEAAQLFGDGWLWRGNRTELQTIGSYTRAVRRVEGQGERWLRKTCLS